jgi:hypothetical protein
VSEPAEAIVRTPIGGWPSAMIRAEFPATPRTLDLAAYELAAFSRRDRRGYVARYNGRDLVAWPHQTVDEIARTHLRMIAMERDRLCKFPPMDAEVRWVAARKLGVLVMIRDGMMSRAAALRAYELSEEELTSWEDSYARDGLPGLEALNLRGAA